MKKYLVFVFILCSIHSFAQEQKAGPLYFQFATQQNRALLYRQMVDTSIRQYLAEPVSDTTEGAWNEAFWSVELLGYRNQFVNSKLKEAWENAQNLSEYFQKNLIEACYAVYPTEFVTPVSRLLSFTTSPQVFIRCAEYLLQADPSESTRKKITDALAEKFSDSKDPGIFILTQRLTEWDKKEPLPPLQDLLSRQFLQGQTVIYSFQRKDRDYPGLVLIRRPDGSFVKNADSSYFHTSQLARAVTNYPFYITNGNTPQGIFRWTGFGISGLAFIGPTPNLQMVMPYEVKPSVFFHDTSLVNADWEKEMYASLLPASWQKYNGMFESFYAGANGRSAIIMHGTTVDPSYYKGKPYYPQTPSLGCLCSYEEWNTKGMRTKSNQQEIDDALDSFDASDGYVVVVDLSDAKKPVAIEEVLPYIKKAEKTP